MTYSAKGAADELIREVGFDPVDAGPIPIARYAEPFALLVAQLAYEREESPELPFSSVPDVRVKLDDSALS